MSWPIKKLGDVLQISRGGSPRPIENYITEDKNGLNWIKIGDVEVGAKYITHTKEKIRKEGLAKTRQVKAGDFLLSNSMSFGRPYITKIDGCIHDGWLSLRDEAKIFNTDFLYHVLNSNAVKDQFIKYASGAVVKNLNIDAVSKVVVAIPPLTEQQRIAELLDTADRILKQRESAIAKLDQLAQSVFIDMFSNCTNFESMKSVVLKKKISQPDVNQHVWSLSLDQIESDTGNLQNKVMVEFKKLGSSTYFFEPPVILYSKLRPYLNKVFMPTDCGYATTELVPLYCNEKKVLPIYLLAVLRSKKFVEFANTNSGGAKMPRVIMDKFWDYEFAVPSIQQQQKFADFFTSILNQKRHCLNAYTLNQTLLSSLQHQSFAVN